MREKPRVLLQEREPSLRRVIKLSLLKAGLETTDVEDFQQATAQLDNMFDIFIIEYSLEVECGSFIQRVRGLPGSPVILVTTTDRLDVEWRKKHQPDLVFYKPFDIRYLERKMLEVLNEKKKIEKTIG